MKRLNYPLLIGVIIIIGILLVSVYPEYFSQVDPYGRQKLELEIEDGITTFITPPVAPCKQYPWGTDHKGRDMRSLIIHGCKQTIVFVLWVAFFRLIISLPIAIFGAYGSKLCKGLIKHFGILFSAFPIVFAIIILSKISIFYELFGDKNTIIAFLLIVLGWSKLANHLMNKVEEILRLEFIEGEIAIGKNKMEIAVQNIIPHIVPSIVVLLFLEIAVVLLSLVQIGILDAVTSNTYISREGEVNVPYEFDWASLLRYSYHLFGTGREWIIIFPAIAFAISIIGFNLLGEGLRLEFEKRKSPVISIIRRVPSFLSPFRFAYEIASYKQNKRSIAYKTIAIALVLVLMFFPQSRGRYIFDSELAYNSSIELNSTMTSEGKETFPRVNYNREKTNYIIDRLKSAGIQPFEGQYMHSFEIDTSVKELESIELSARNGKEAVEFVNGYDFYCLEFFYTNSDYEIKVFKPSDIRDMTIEEMQSMENKIAVIDMREDSESGNVLLSWIYGRHGPLGVIMIGGWKSGYKYSYAGASRNGQKFRILMSEDAGERLLAMNDAYINFNASPKIYFGNEDVNIYGMIPGDDESLKNEIVIVGAAINSTDDNGMHNNTEELAILLELERSFGEYKIMPKRTILFAFWGGNNEFNRGSKALKNVFLGVEGKRLYYFDIRNVAGEDIYRILCDTSRIMPKDDVGQSIIRTMKTMGKRNDISLFFGSIPSLQANDFYNSNSAAIVLDKNVAAKAILFKNEKKIETEKQMNNIGQMLLDMLVDITEAEN